MAIRIFKTTLTFHTNTNVIMLIKVYLMEKLTVCSIFNMANFLKCDSALQYELNDNHPFFWIFLEHKHFISVSIQDSMKKLRKFITQRSLFEIQVQLVYIEYFVYIIHIIS